MRVRVKLGSLIFFEHLLFEGSENIERGQWDVIVNSNGGFFNANTTADRTYYYVVFPSNNLELSLWLESERMLNSVDKSNWNRYAKRSCKRRKKKRRKSPICKAF